jgi:hypothetical protein
VAAENLNKSTAIRMPLGTGLKDKGNIEYQWVRQTVEKGDIEYWSARRTALHAQK